MTGALRLVQACSAILLAGATTAAAAHSASDAYLTLDASSSSTIHVQWDIALRDLDFVMKLDDDGDGRIVWKELRRHQPEIARYALSNIAFRRDGKPCATKLVRQQVSDHADGAYAALFIDVTCASSAAAPAAPAAPLTLDYRLFFSIDPSHRAIVVSRRGSETSTALLSPQNPTIKF